MCIRSSSVVLEMNPVHVAERFQIVRRKAFPDVAREFEAAGKAGLRKRKVIRCQRFAQYTKVEACIVRDEQLPFHVWFYDRP